VFDPKVMETIPPIFEGQDLPSIPGELFEKFQISFYADPVNALFKTLGVE